MSQIENIINQIIPLTKEDKRQIQLVQNSMISNNEYNKEMFTTELREMRFNKGKICPKCDLKHVVKNGKFNGKQRYLCKDCRKTYNDFTSTPLSDSIRI